jgi:trk system potassium uptake protein TrkA
MRIIVVGCGLLGSALAYQLYKQGHLVTVIEQNEAAFDHLPVDFQGQAIKGDVLDQNVLHRAQIEDADALAVTTRSDSLNVLVAYIAKTEYHVAKVVAANNDLLQRPIQEAFGISIVSSAGWGEQQLIELLSDTPLRAFHFGSDPNFMVYQLQVPASWQGHALQELLPEDRRKTLSMTRAGRPLPVSGTEILQTGDSIYLMADPAEIESLRNQLDLQREQKV